MSVFGWDDFGRDRKGKGERGEKKLFWVVWLEGKRGEILVEPMHFLPVPTKKINPQFGESYGEIIGVGRGYMENESFSIYPLPTAIISP